MTDPTPTLRALARIGEYSDRLRALFASNEHAPDMDDTPIRQLLAEFAAEQREADAPTVDEPIRLVDWDSDHGYVVMTRAQYEVRDCAAAIRNTSASSTTASKPAPTFRDG